MAEKPNPLLQGIADAIAGGALAGLSKEAGTDFLSPFLQAQQRRIAQAQERGSNAFTTYNSASRAAREAFAANPLGEGRYQSAVDNAQQRLNMALENVDDPAARNALMEMHRADVEYYKQARDGGIISNQVQLGSSGDFSFLTQGTIDSRLLQASLEQLAGPSTVIGKNFAEYQMLAERSRNLVGTAGQFAGGIGEAEQFGIKLPPELQEVLDYVNATEGGLVPWAMKNGEQARVLLERLATTNPRAIQSLHTNLEKQERTVDFRVSLGRGQAAATGAVGGFYNSENYEIDNQGNFILKRSAISPLIKDVTDNYDYAGDRDAFLDRVERDTGVDLSEIRKNTIPQGAVRVPSTNFLGDDVREGVDQAMQMVRDGVIVSASEDRRLMALVENGQRDQAIQYLENSGLLTPVRVGGQQLNAGTVFDFLSQGPAHLARNLASEAVSGDKRADSEIGALQDQLAIAEEVGDSARVERIQAEIAQIQDFQGSGLDIGVIDMHEDIFRAVTSNYRDGFDLDEPKQYYAALKGVTQQFTQAGLLDAAPELSDEVKKEIKKIARMKDPAKRHEAFGRLVIDATYGKLDPQGLGAKGRTYAFKVARDSLEKITGGSGIAAATIYSPAFREAVGSEEGETQLDSLYRFLSKGPRFMLTPGVTKRTPQGITRKPEELTETLDVKGAARL